MKKCLKLLIALGVMQIVGAKDLLVKVERKSAGKAHDSFTWVKDIDENGSVGSLRNALAERLSELSGERVSSDRLELFVRKDGKKYKLNNDEALIKKVSKNFSKMITYRLLPPSLVSDRPQTISTQKVAAAGALTLVALTAAVASLIKIRSYKIKNKDLSRNMGLAHSLHCKIRYG